MNGVVVAEGGRGLLAGAVDCPALKRMDEAESLSEREALLPRMNAGAPTERHSHFLTKSNALLSRMWGSFHRAARKNMAA